MAKTVGEIITHLQENKVGICDYLRDKGKLETYVKIQRSYLSVNVSQNKDFKSQYHGFYRLRMPNIKGFYEYFEKTKHEDTPYEEILTELQSITGRLETSFSSKMAHVKKPNLAIIDSMVFNFIGWRKPQGLDRLQKTVILYDKLQELSAECIAHPGWAELSSYFDSVINFEGFPFSEAKKLDAFMWKAGSK